MDNNHFKYMDSLFLDEFKLLEELDICSKDELEVVEKENATILTYKVSGNQKLAGVIDENGVYVNISSFDALSPVDSWGGTYILNTKQEHIHETVVYFGRFWKHWGYFLMDMV